METISSPVRWCHGQWQGQETLSKPLTRQGHSHGHGHGHGHSNDQGQCQCQDQETLNEPLIRQGHSHSHGHGQCQGQETLDNQFKPSFTQHPSADPTALRWPVALRWSRLRFYAFYAFYAWWFHFPQSGALAEGTSRPTSRKHDQA